MTKKAEKPYLWGRTYLYSQYKGVPPPPGFITCIGKEAVEVHNGLPFGNDEQEAGINKILEWKITASGKQT